MIDDFYVIALIVAILVILSAFFSGVETALTAVSKGRIYNMARQGLRRALLVQKLQEQKERLIGVLLLANNLVNIFASALATSAFIIAFGPKGVLYATIFMTLIIVILAEILPKTYALYQPTRLSLIVAPVVHAVFVLFSPISYILKLLVGRILILFNIRPSTPDKQSYEEELRGAIELHARSGSDQSQERAMLRSILDLDNVDVGEIMVPRKDMFTLNTDLAWKDFLTQAANSAHSRIPIWHHSPDNIVGVIHVRHLLGSIPTNNHEGKDITNFATKPWFVPESTSLLQQLQLFRRRREHFALVVDEYGGLLGVVTLEDILEEIVGDISDEFDRISSNLTLGGDGSIIVSGDTTVRDINRQCDWDLPDEEAATIAGFVMYETRSLPKTGQIFRLHGYYFNILQCQQHHLMRLRIHPPSYISSSQLRQAYI